MGVVVGIGVTPHAEVDFEMGVSLSQLIYDPVKGVSCSGIEIWVQRNRFKAIGVDSCESVDKVRTERYCWF